MVGLLIFVATFIGISVRRLPFDRPGVVWLGAVAMVLAGVISPDVALEAVDRRTILLLLAVMGIAGLFGVDGSLDQAEAWVLSRARTPRRLLAWVVWSAGLFAALVTNDAVAVLAAPVLVRLTKRYELPCAPYLLALALSVNTGSAATLVGNPQNMLCAALGNLRYGAYLLDALPVALGGLAIGHAWLLFRYSTVLPTMEFPPASRPTFSAAHGGTFLVLLGVAAVATAGFDLAWTMAAGFALLILLHRKEGALWTHIDWPLLLFFAGLFIVVEGLTATGIPAAVFARFPLNQFGPVGFAAVVLVGSNVVSNVPLILVVASEVQGEAAWSKLALLSTLAGNLTLVGSVANLIIVSAAGGKLGFREHLRVGVPVTLLSTAWALVWLAL